MPLQAWVDESEGEQGVYVFAGLMSTVSRWLSFSQDWQDELQGDPREIDYFKMHEAAHLRGEFSGWSEADRDGKVKSLARIINGHVPRAFYCMFDLEGFSDTFAEFNEKPLDQPYFWAFQITIMALAFDVDEIGEGEPFEIIFDEHDVFGSRARRYYPVVRETMKGIHGEVGTLMPTEPRFEDDERFLPLQAADMFAWCWRRTNSGMENPFDWVVPEISNVTLSPHSQVYTTDRMWSVLEQSFDFDVADFPASAVRRYRDIYGDSR